MRVRELGKSVGYGLMLILVQYYPYGRVCVFNIHVRLHVRLVFVYRFSSLYIVPEAREGV